MSGISMLERIKSMLSALGGGRPTEISEPSAKTLYVQSEYDEKREAEFEALMQAEYEEQMKDEMDLKVVEPATNLPEGFEWCHWGDGSGGLYKDGKQYASYDEHHEGYIEYMVLGGGWEISELRVSLGEVQDDIEKRVLNHLNIQQKEVETLGTKDAVSRPEPVQEDEQQAEALEPELRAGQKFFDPDLDRMLKKEFFGQFDRPEEYTPEEWNEMCSREPPDGIITITQKDIDQGEIDVGLEFLTVEEFKKRVKDGYYQPIPQQGQNTEREAHSGPAPELDGEELEL